jgi:hypothetical protein
MSWSTSIAFKNHRAFSIVLVFAMAMVPIVGLGQEVSLRAPSGVLAGMSAAIGTSGEGSGTFYLVGPSASSKRDVQLGQDIALSANEIESAGRYIAIVCTNTCSSVDFYVSPSKPATLTFLAHPSRVPVGQGDAISGVALPFDEFHNLVLKQQTVNFQLITKGAPSASRTVQTENGVAWFRTNSGKAAGPMQIAASLDGIMARRVVQQVASDPCNLRIKGQRTGKGIVVETDPIRDCAGNPVPDGTIVTFTARNGNEVSTVDAPVKQDIARAQITASGPLVISAASGVVMGNELRLGAE